MKKYSIIFKRAIVGASIMTTLFSPLVLFIPNDIKMILFIERILFIYVLWFFIILISLSFLKEKLNEIYFIFFDDNREENLNTKEAKSLKKKDKKVDINLSRTNMNDEEFGVGGDIPQFEEKEEKSETLIKGEAMMENIEKTEEKDIAKAIETMINKDK